MSFIKSQFGHPTGLLGRLVGAIMAYENRERNNWAVRLLNIQSRDYVLEVGFGPGLAIQHVARIAVEGFVAGVDASEVMIQQARNRNAAAIQAGRVDLSHSSAAALPYRDNTFDKAFAVNSMHHWPDTAAGLSELRRVLKPGGLVAITEQPRGAVDEAAVREIAEKLIAKLSAAGFRQIRMEFRPMRPATSTCALGVK